MWFSAAASRCRKHYHVRLGFVSGYLHPLYLIIGSVCYDHFQPKCKCTLCQSVLYIFVEYAFSDTHFICIMPMPSDRFSDFFSFSYLFAALRFFLFASGSYISMQLPPSLEMVSFASSSCCKAIYPNFTFCKEFLRLQFSFYGCIKSFYIHLQKNSVKIPFMQITAFT